MRSRPGAGPRLVIAVAVIAAAGSGAVRLAHGADDFDTGLARAAAAAEPYIPFVFGGTTYIKTEDGEVTPLLKEGPGPQSKPRPQTRGKQPTLAAPAPVAALWPARFPRTLLTAKDVAAAKAAGVSRPKNFDLLPWQTPIKDQGRRGTCYAFAFTAGLEAAYRHKYGKLVDGKYQGPQWILSEESVIHLGKSTLLNRPQTYLFENPSSYWEGVIGVVGGPLMTSVLSEQMMSYRVPELKYSPYLALSSPTPQSPPGLMQLAEANACPTVGALAKTWVGAPPKLDAAGACSAGNCATQGEVDVCEYAPGHISPDASRNARFGISFPTGHRTAASSPAPRP